MSMVWILIAAGICLADLSIKHYIDENKKENCHEPVLGGHIIITRYHNPGAMLGWLKDKPRMLLGITLFALGVLTAGLMGALRKGRSPFIKLGLTLILGGAASNAYDRIMNHQVTDYFRISMGSKKLERIIFNLGDMAIFAGSLLAVLGELQSD